MRPPHEIQAMRDRLHCQHLTAGGVSEAVLTALDWTTNSLVPDLELLALAETDESGDDLHLRVDDILHGLPFVASPGNLDTHDYLFRITDEQLDELAAAARRIDRLCKAEMKEREKKRAKT